MNKFLLFALLACSSTLSAFGFKFQILSIADTYIYDNFPKLKTAVDSFKAQCQKDCYSILVHSGDFLLPSFFSSLDFGQGMVTLMKNLQFDYIILGNHESDVSFPYLEKYLLDFQKSNTTVLTTNIVFNSGVNEPYGVPYHLIKIANKTIGFVGLLTNDEKEYNRNRFNGSMLLSPRTSLSNVVHDHPSVDLWIAFTHLSWKEDKSIAESGLVSLIIGGHDHDERIKTINNVPIVKPGKDAEYLSVISIDNIFEKSLEIDIMVKPVSKFPKNKFIQSLVEKITKDITESQSFKDLEKIELFPIPLKSSKRFTTKDKDIRFEESEMVKLILSKLKIVHKSELVLMTAGNIRGDYDYSLNKKSMFTAIDLQKEFPFDSNRPITIELPGFVILESIAYSRIGMGVESKSDILHTDAGVLISMNERKKVQIISINNETFDPKRMYHVTLNSQLLEGLDIIQPLIDYRGYLSPASDFSFLPEIKSQFLNYFNSNNSQRHENTSEICHMDNYSLLNDINSFQNELSILIAFLFICLFSKFLFYCLKNNNYIL